MLTWFDELYISESLQKKHTKLIKRIEKGKPTVGVYLLTYPTNEHNVMDIVSANLLMQKTYRRRCPKIIGLANGQEEAYELMEQILMESYQQTGSFHVKKYLEDR